MPPPSSLDLLRNQLQRARLLRERKDAVCGLLHPEYDARPEDRASYVYTPERCTLRRRGTTPGTPGRRSRRAPPSSPAAQPPSSAAGSVAADTGRRSVAANARRRDAEGYVDLMREDHARVRDLSARFPPPPPHAAIRAPLTDEQMQDTRLLMHELLMLQYSRASLLFLNDTFPRMISPQEIRAEPDPGARVNRMLRTWMDGELRRSGRGPFAAAAKARMFALMLSHYESAFHPAGRVR